MTACSGCPALHGENGYLTPPRLVDAPHRPLRLPQSWWRGRTLFNEAQLNGEIKRQERVTPYPEPGAGYAADRQG